MSSELEQILSNALRQLALQYKEDMERIEGQNKQLALQNKQLQQQVTSLSNQVNKLSYQVEQLTNAYNSLTRILAEEDGEGSVS